MLTAQDALDFRTSTDVETFLERHYHANFRVGSAVRWLAGLNDSNQSETEKRVIDTIKPPDLNIYFGQGPKIDTTKTKMFIKQVIITTMPVATEIVEFRKETVFAIAYMFVKKFYHPLKGQILSVESPVNFQKNRFKLLVPTKGVVTIRPESGPIKITLSVFVHILLPEFTTAHTTYVPQRIQNLCFRTLCSITIEACAWATAEDGQVDTRTSYLWQSPEDR
jgi:hypothetical protein